MAIQTLTLSADGAIVTGWRAEAGDYTRLQTDDGDTTRLYTPTSGDIATFVLTDPTGSGVVNSITVFGKFRSIDPVSNTMQLGFRLAGVNYWSANFDTVTSQAFILFSNSWTINPVTGIAWTFAQIADLECGMQKTNGVGGAMTYMYMEVNHNPGNSMPGNIGGKIKTGDGMSRAEVAN